MRVRIDLLAKFMEITFIPHENDHEDLVTRYHKLIAETYSYEIKEFIPPPKYAKNATGRYEKRQVTVYREGLHLLPLGLLHHLYNTLKTEFGFPKDAIEVVDKAHAETNGRVRPLTYKLHKSPMQIFNDKTPRYYQLEAVKEAVKHRFGQIVLPTGAGKSEVMCLIIEEMKPKVTLIAVTGTELIDQTYKAIAKRYPRANVKRWDSKATLSQKKHALGYSPADQVIIVTSYETFNKYVGTPLIDNIDLLLMDEIQKISCETFSPVVEKTPYVYAAIGFSATPFRDDNETLLVHGLVGRVLYRKSLKELVDEGYLAKPTIKVANIFTPEGLVWLMCQSLKKKIVVFHEQKVGGKWVGTDLKGGVQHTKDVFTHIAEGFKEPYRTQALLFIEKSYWLSSQVKGCRESIADFKKAKTGCVFTTPLMDEGVDIPDISTVVFADVRGKHSGAIVKNIQRVGRALRRPDDSHAEALCLIHSTTKKPTKLYDALTSDHRAFGEFDHGEPAFFPETYVKQIRETVYEPKV